MFKPLSLDVAKIIQRERLEEAKSQQMFKGGSVSDPMERGKYIKAFHRQLLEEIQKAENRRLRRKAIADHGLP